MEIISYVGKSSRSRKFVMPDFSAFSNGISSVIPKFSTLKKRPHIFSTEKTFTYQPFSPELKSFDVQKVRKPFNIKSLLTIVGHSVTLVQDYIYDNSNILSIHFLAFNLTSSSIVISSPVLPKSAL